MKAIEITCGSCKAGPQVPCVENIYAAMTGSFHKVRVIAAGKASRQMNLERKANANQAR